VGRGDIVFIIITTFLLGFIGGVIFSPQNVQIQTQQQVLQPVRVESERIVELGIPAVDEEGKGVVGEIITTVRSGTGKTNVNVDNVISLPSFQQSAKLARAAAVNYTKRDLSTVDIDFDVRVNASIIEGPSAGSTMVVAVVLALDNIPASKNIMMTGTILENTTIGPVGAITEKATAAKEAGATMFLVPAGQGTQLSSTRIRTCRQIGNIQICQISYKYSPVSLSQSLNITIQEVGSLEQAVEIFKKAAQKPVTV